MRPRRILMLVGSPTNAFYEALSRVYASGALDALASPHYRFTIALITPDGMWRFPRSLDPDAIAAAVPMTVTAALDRIVAATFDAALPQLFCRAGMTDYRALLDLLAIPYLGNRPMQMALALDKAKARAIVASAGVAVPGGELLSRAERPQRKPPLVVKPNDADNSDGVSLVTSENELDGALAEAFLHASSVLVEDYIELGREVRCGLVARGDELIPLPLEEYFVDRTLRPIRLPEHKLKRGGTATIALAAKEPTEAWIVDRADPIVEAVWAAARRCHIALGCRQYSLFDFRIDPDGKPWFLEAGLYCSFSPQSVLATMMNATGTPVDRFFADALDELVTRSHTN